MTIQKGRDVIIQTKMDNNEYELVAGMRTNSFSFNNQLVDITTASSPEQWRELASDVGLKSISISGNGIFANNNSQKHLFEIFFQQKLIDCKLIIPELYEVQGMFVITNLDLVGDYEKEATMSIAMESASSIFLNPVVA